jgi:hypothetical protein
VFPTLAAPQKGYLYANTLPWQTKTGCFILEQTQIVVTSISDIGNFSKHKIFRNDLFIDKDLPYIWYYILRTRFLRFRMLFLSENSWHR